MALPRGGFVMVVMLFAANQLPPSGARKRVKVEPHCPALEICHCHVSNRRAMVVCSDIDNSAHLALELSKLRNTSIYGLDVIRVNITVIPSFYFANLNVKILSLTKVPVDFVEEDAFANLTKLWSLQFQSNMLTAIPTVLSNLRELKVLSLIQNFIETIGNELSSLKTLTELNLSYNVIKNLDPLALKYLENLRELRLGNNRIDSLPPDFFKTTRSLRFIDLRNNRLRTAYDAFQGLQELQVLLLSQNLIVNIDKLSKVNFPKLRTLRVSHNPITNISRFGVGALEELHLRSCNISDVHSLAFQMLGNIKRIDVSENFISYINESAFHKLSRLEYFNGANNVIVSVYRTFNKNRKLRRLNLTMNMISNITYGFSECRSLTGLALRLNEIQFIEDTTFTNTANLESLDLSYNKIRWLGKYCFKNLVNLKEVLMNNNLLVKLNGSLSHLRVLRHISLQENNLEAFETGDFENDPKLGFIHAFRNNLTSINGAFGKLRNLRKVWLQENRLQVVHRKSFPPSLSAVSVLVIEANPIVCDCQVSWLLTETAHLKIRGVPVCEGPSWLKGNLLYDLTSENLTEWKDGCDQKCICECRDDDSFGRNVFVNCSDRNLTHLPVTLPLDTVALDLSGNSLESLDPAPSEAAGLATNTPFLRFLNLSNNLLSSVGPSAIPPETKDLNLQGNRLTTFPIDMVSNISLSRLELAGNPWSCGCKDYAFRLWMEANNEIIADTEQIACAESPNHLVSLKRFVDLGQKDLCPSMISKILSYGLSFLVLLIISLAASTAYLRHKRKIKIWLYARGVCSSLQCIKEDDLDEDKVFDVFLSFSSKDSAWAYEQLIPGVESQGFSVCTYDRNFKGGFLLQDIIQEAVSSSKRTLMLLTRNFVESDWCRWEFRVAHRQAFEDKINRLIVVLVDEVAPDLVDEELRLYMQATNYLRWGETHFWDKLIYSLPKKDSRRKLILDPQEYPMTAKSGSD